MADTAATPITYSATAAADSISDLMDDMFPSETPAAPAAPAPPVKPADTRPVTKPQAFDDADAEVEEAGETEFAEGDEGEAVEEVEESGQVESPPDGEMLDPEFDDIPKSLADLNLPAPDPNRANVKFAVRDAEGEVEAPVDLAFTFKADGGKIFKDIPLAQLVGLAQRGVYNARVAEEARELREIIPQASQAINEYQKALTEMKAEYDLLMTSDEALDAARDRFHASQSPEGRVRSLEEELHRERETYQQKEDNRVRQTAVQSHVVPRLDSLAAAHSAVSMSEMAAQYDRLLAPLRRNGVIPPARMAEAIRLIDTELEPWVEEMNRVRLGQDRAATRRTTTSAKTAVAAQNKVRSIERRRVGTVTPVPSKTPNRGKPSGQPTIQTRESVMDDIRADIARQFGD